MDDACRNYKCTEEAEPGSKFGVQNSKFTSAEDEYGTSNFEPGTGARARRARNSRVPVARGYFLHIVAEL